VHVQAQSWLASKLKGPAVLTVHGISERIIRYSGTRGAWLKAAVVALTDGRARSRVSNIICISPYVRRFLGKARARVWGIENPVSPAFFEIVRQPVAGRILYTGHVIPRKNVLGLIRAVALVRRSLSNVYLRVAGGGLETPYGKECQHIAAALSVADCVSFLGSLSPADLSRELTTASCLALCSFEETAPMSIEEAMAAGVPVVASDVGGVAAMVKDGETGRLIEPDDDQGIADALLDVLARGPASDLGARAKQEASRRFAPSVVAARTCDVYRAVLDAPGST
jgi:glycosyltransferase involved in cell wall biosynthesis